MTHVPHELHEEFPEHSDRLHQLKTGSAHFATLASRIKVMASIDISEKRRHQDGRSALAMPSSGSNVMAHLNTPLSLFETQAVAPFSQRNDLH